MLRRPLLDGIISSRPYVCLSCRLALRQSAFATPVPRQHLFRTAIRSYVSPSEPKAKSQATVKAKKVRHVVAKRKKGRRKAPKITKHTSSSKVSIRRVRSEGKFDIGAPAKLTVPPATGRRLRRLKLLSKGKESGAGLQSTRPDDLDDGTSLGAMGQALKHVLGKESVKSGEEFMTLKGRAQRLEVIDVDGPPVPRLAHGLDRVLFNPGVCHVRDPRSRVYNFEPHLEKLAPVHKFNFDTLTMFTPPSKDTSLAQIAQAEDKKYIASTSSMTGILKHFHFLLSRWRDLKMDMLSKQFPSVLNSFTKMTRAPDAVFLRWKDGFYAVDADKMYDGANVLSLMGRYMEKLLTESKEGFQKHMVGSSEVMTQEDRDKPEAYHYSTIGDFILRSQLDAYDSRLPGTGMFDLKTRAVVPIRMDSGDFEWGMGYEIKTLKGEWNSFEREYHDMIRSTMLKYSLQVRMGRMDGIFVAFHNIARIFGFQYVGLDEMDYALHGQNDPTLGDQEFLLSLRLVNEIFNRATEKFPEQTIRFHFETREASDPFMYIFAEPVTEEEANQLQSTNSAKIAEWEYSILHPEESKTPETDPGIESGSQRADSDSVMGERLEDVLKKNMDPAALNVEQDVTSDFVPESTTKQQNPRSSQSEDPEITSTDDQDSSANGAPKSSDTPALQLKSEGPLLGMALAIRSRVNGKPVPRPPNPLQATDQWTVDYSLMTIDKESRAWGLYNACRTRRDKEMREAATRDRDSTRPDYYRDILKRVTEQSRAWRAQVDERDGKRRPRMWNEGERDRGRRPSSRSPIVSHDEEPSTRIRPLVEDLVRKLLNDEERFKSTMGAGGVALFDKISNKKWIGKLIRGAYKPPSSGDGISDESVQKIARRIAELMRRTELYKRGQRNAEEERAATREVSEDQDDVETATEERQRVGE